ncbi:hypothetical protein ECV0102_19150 [Enterobacter cloacae]|nr:hypothetical protein ECV0102_19150 [Enterobacter cloacae]
MWLMKTLLTSGCTNQRGAGHHAYESAQIQCARALHFILDAKNQHYWSSQLADEMTKRGKQ